MFRKIFKRYSSEGVYSVTAGKLVEMSDIKDSTFNKGFLGPTIGILPSKYSVYSPFSGEITMVFKTKHAIGLRRRDGLELLIHIGIETVQLKGKGFDVKVKEGELVKRGDLLVEFNNNILKEKAIDNTIIIVFTNSNDFDITLCDNKKSIKLGDMIANAKRKSL